MGRPPLGNVAMTGAERQRRHWLKHKPAPKPAAVTIGQLQKQLKEAKKRILDLEDDNAALKGALDHERKRQVSTAPGPKPKKAPLPPDEARDRQIKSLKTRIQHLNGLLDASEKHYMEAIALTGGMDRETRIAIDKALQPDRRIHATEAEKDALCDKACRSWNAWKNTSDKARRR